MAASLLALAVLALLVMQSSSLLHSRLCLRQIPCLKPPAEPACLSRHKCSGRCPRTGRLFSNTKHTLEDIVWRKSGLPADDVIRAIDRADHSQGSSTSDKYRRFTVSDISSLTGRDLQSSKENLMLLSRLTGSPLQVTDAGDIVYLFPSDKSIRTALMKQSLAMRSRQIIGMLMVWTFNAFKVAFAGALIVSTAIIVVSLIALSSTHKTDKEEKSRNKVHRHHHRVPTVRIDLSGLIRLFDVMISSRRRVPGHGADRDFKLSEVDAREVIAPYAAPVVSRHKEETLPFVLSIFSYVFGDGNPNREFPSAQIVAVTRRIRELKGVVAAEDLAPYLNSPPVSERDSSSAVVNEGWMMDAVLSLGGTPSVTERGNIAYVFDDVVLSSFQGGTYDQEVKRKSYYCPLYLEERRVPFSLARPWQIAISFALCAFNLLGLVEVSALLANRAHLQSLDFVKKILPAMRYFALLVNISPLLRFVANIFANRSIERRNNVRREWAEAVSVRVNERNALTEKLADVRAYAKALGASLKQQQSIDNVQLDTSRMGTEYTASSELAAFDKRLEQTTE